MSVLSVPADARMDVSDWLNLTALMVSAPQLRVVTGFERVESQMSITEDAVAKVCSLRWWVTPLKAPLPRYVATGTFPLLAAYGSHILTVRSLAQDSSRWSSPPRFVKHMPFTTPSCAFTVSSSFRSARSQIFSSPSPEPEAITLRERGSLARE